MAGKQENYSLVSEYSTARRTVHQEMLYRQLKQCCGDCSGWFHGWAMMLHQRNIDDREPRSYFHMEVPEFRAHVKACEEAMAEADRVDSCLEGLDRVWEKDWRNPLDNRFNQRTKEQKIDQYRHAYGGRCIDPEYHIEG